MADAGDGTHRHLRSAPSRLPTGSLNGNLQINQFYNGAVQPSDVAAAVAQAMLYGNSQENAFPQSDPNILADGNLNWTDPQQIRGQTFDLSYGSGTDVAVDPTGGGTSYFTKWPFYTRRRPTSRRRRDVRDGRHRRRQGRPGADHRGAGHRRRRVRQHRRPRKRRRRGHWRRRP